MPAPLGAPRSPLACLLATGLLLAWADSGLAATDSVEIQPDPGGGLHATAVLQLSAPPEVVQQFLTDY
jgi:hypothetical protein